MSILALESVSVTMPPTLWSLVLSCYCFVVTPCLLDSIYYIITDSPHTHSDILQLKQHWRQVWMLGSQNKWGYRLSLLNSSIRTMGSQPALLQVVSKLVFYAQSTGTVISGRNFRSNWKTVPQSQHWQLMVMGPWAWEWEWVSHFTFRRMSAPSS